MREAVFDLLTKGFWVRVEQNSLCSCEDKEILLQGNLINRPNHIEIDGVGINKKDILSVELEKHFTTNDTEEAILHVSPRVEEQLLSGRRQIPCVAAFSGNSMLLLQRRDGSWCLPSGKKELGETNHECAVRKFKEETGFHVLNPVSFMFLETIKGIERPDLEFPLFVCQISGKPPLKIEPTFIGSGWFTHNETLNLSIMSGETVKAVWDWYFKEVAPLGKP